MSRVVPIERPLLGALEALALEVGLGTILLGDMLAGDPAYGRRLLERTCQRLTYWHWHPELARIIPRVRSAAASLREVRDKLAPLPLERVLENPDAHAFLAKCHGEVDDLRCDLVAWIYEIKEGRTPTFTPGSYARVSQARV